MRGGDTARTAGRRGTTTVAALAAAVLATTGLTADAAGQRPVPPDVQAVGATPAPVPPAALAPTPDFAVSVKRTSGPSRKARSRTYAVTLKNVAAFPTTSVRACMRLSRNRARFTGLVVPGSEKRPEVACWQYSRFAPGQSRPLSFRVRTNVPLSARRTTRVDVTVTAGNANAYARALKLGGPATRKHRRPRKARRGARRATAATVAPRERVARPRQAPSCDASGTLGIAFVADDSGSMESNDPQELRADAIGIGLDQLPDGSTAGATSFDDVSRELFAPATVDASSRAQMKQTARDRLTASGETYYELAFKGAQEQLAKMSTTRKAVVFLSDGAPTDEDFTSDREIAKAGTPIFTVGFGSADKAVLADIAARSGGQTYAASTAADLDSIFAQVVARLTCAAANTSTAVDLPPGQTTYVPFSVGLNDAELRALASWTGGKVAVSAVRPRGGEVSPASLHAGETFSDNPTYALISARDPQVGDWQLKLVASAENASAIKVSIDVFDKAVPPLPPQPPVDVASDGRRRDPCLSLYGAATSTTKKITGGEQTDYPRRTSQYLVCAGFGQPEALELSLGMKCAFVTAGAVLAGGATGPAELVLLDQLCGATDTLTDLQSGEWAGAAGAAACNFFGSVFATGVGVTAAGATAVTGFGPIVGTATYRAFAAGSAIACGGLFEGGARDFGIKLEADHQTNVAADVMSRGKCLRYTTRLGYVKWSAADCIG